VPSGRKSRASRHTAVASPPGRGTRRASPRVIGVAAGVVVIAAVAIVLAVVLGGGSKTKTNVPAVGSLANALPGAAEVHTLFKGIPQSGLQLGKASAPVTVVEYLDLQCPYCREVEVSVIPDIVTRYVRPGKAKIMLHPLAFTGSDSVRGRNALIAASEQDHAFDFADVLYLNQGVENTGWLNDHMVEAAAASIPGLKVPALLDERNAAGVSKLAKQFDSLAAAAHVDATPTFVIGSSFGGAKTTLVAPTAQALSAAIQAALS